jgi:hypothetical protein
VDSLITDFETNGFTIVRGAIDPATIDACYEVIAHKVRACGIDLNDPSSWRDPVTRINCPEGPVFATAGTSPDLSKVYDQLLGSGRWRQRPGVGGTIPVRFPRTADPGDSGWHIDGSYDVNGQYRVNVNSRVRGLLALFLFSDVTEDDAPTEIIPGSHMHIPTILAPYGPDGVFFGDVVPAAPKSLFDASRTLSVGTAGDVYVCHPFLVHRATWPDRGSRPRVIAQPEIAHADACREGLICAMLIHRLPARSRALDQK